MMFLATNGSLDYLKETCILFSTGTSMVVTKSSTTSALAFKSQNEPSQKPDAKYQASLELATNKPSDILCTI